MESETKFNIGDKVRIVNYGHPIMVHKDEYQRLQAYFRSMDKAYLNTLLTGNYKVIIEEPDINEKPKNIIQEKDEIIAYDSSPQLVGQEGIIEKATITQGISNYSITGIKGKCAWYHDDQLEMINKNPNNE